MKKSYIFAAILVLLAAGAGRMIERNSPTEADIYHYVPPSLQADDAIEAYPVDDWYQVEPTVVFPYEAYPAPVDPSVAYPAPYWDLVPTPAPEPTMAYPAPEYGGYPAPEYGGYPVPNWPYPEYGAYPAPYPAP